MLGAKITHHRLESQHLPHSFLELFTHLEMQSRGEKSCAAIHDSGEAHGPSKPPCDLSQNEVNPSVSMETRDDLCKGKGGDRGWGVGHQSKGCVSAKARGWGTLGAERGGEGGGD